MIRGLAACSAAVLVALAAPSSAAPPHITDPEGDWHVPSQDIVAGSLATDRSRRVVATITVAAPLAEVPGTYYFLFARGECDSYIAVLDWRGRGFPHTSSLEKRESCTSSAAPPELDAYLRPAVVFAAPATVAGDTIAWTLPALPDFAKGQRLRNPLAVGAPNPEVYVGLMSSAEVLNTFDMGFSNRDYVVGATR